MTTAESPYEFLKGHAPPTRGNVTAHVTDSLRRAIVTLELAPGEVIDKGAICAQLGVSRFPVSEALSRLQTEGLVDILPQRGSIVSLVRIADVVEYMLIRKALEAEAVRVATANQTVGMIGDLQRNMSAQRAAAELGDRYDFHELDLEFHDVIFSNMHFAKVKAVIESSRANLDRARRLILSPRRLELTMAEHRAILDGIISGDSHHAASAMRAHIDSVMGELLAFAGDKPEIFADGALLRDQTGHARFPFG
jgi:GntR family transcriptional regulator, rspAB operon transcriptional repressor